MKKKTTKKKTTKKTAKKSEPVRTGVVHYTKEGGGSLCGRGDNIVGRKASVTCKRCKHTLGLETIKRRPHFEAKPDAIDRAVPGLSPDMRAHVRKSFEANQRAMYGLADFLEYSGYKNAAEVLRMEVRALKSAAADF